jgi:hypothetical protein
MVAADMMAAGHPLQYSIVEGLTLCFAVQVSVTLTLAFKFAWKIALSPSLLRISQLDEPSAAQLLKLFASFLPDAAREAGRRHAAVANDAAAVASSALHAGPIASARAAQPLAGAKRKKAAAVAAAAEERAIVSAVTVAGLAGGSSGVNLETHMVVEGVVVPRGALPAVDRAAGDASYVLVPSVRRHLHNLSRAVSTSMKFPVLLQVSTSAFCGLVCSQSIDSAAWLCRDRRPVGKRAQSSTSLL